MLPRRQFTLIGPGRWGSRGDIKLGVRVTYSDINNTSLLIEVAARRGNYVPDLSFGTHFFQDLVEAGIRYVPLFPGERDVVFNSAFLLDAPNALAELVPEYAHLAPAVPRDRRSAGDRRPDPARADERRRAAGARVCSLRRPSPRLDLPDCAQ